MKWVRASAMRPLLQSDLPEFWYQSPELVYVRLLLFCFFTQKQRKTIQMSYCADNPMEMGDGLLFFIIVQNAVSFFVK